MLEDRALAVVNGDFYVMDLMTLVIMPISLTLMIGSVIILPFYLVWLMTEIPHIIHCWGRVAEPEKFPECYDTSPRSHNRHNFPECHPDCVEFFLAKKNQNNDATRDQTMSNIEQDDGSFDY